MEPISSSAAEPLRCLHYVDAVREEAGGVVRAVLDLTAALAAAGVEVTLLTRDASDVPGEWLAGGEGLPHAVEVHPRQLSKPGSLLQTHLAAADVLHLHTPWDLFNPRLARSARKHGTPYVVSIHGMLDDWSMAQRGLKKRLYLALRGRRMLEGAARLHFTAEGERDQAMKWSPRGRAAVLPLVMDLQPYRELPGPELAREAFPALASEVPKLLFLSRVHYKKGVDLLIEAVAGLRDAGRPVDALIAGPGEEGYLAQLREQAAARGVADQVHFLGMVRGETKVSLYQACDLFVLPTSQENFGIVLPEAMACAVPIVTTRGVDIWRELQSRGGVIVDRDAAAMTQAIASLLAEPAALAERGEASRRGVFEWLDPGSVVAGYIDLYRQCL